jgi:predicted XRE-type DNA-binding protein
MPTLKQLKISQMEIAKIFNISKSTISDIKNNKSWQHLNL